MLVRFCFVLWELFTKFASLQHQKNYHYLKAPAVKRSDVYKNHSPLIARPQSSNIPQHKRLQDKIQIE